MELRDTANFRYKHTLGTGGGMRIHAGIEGLLFAIRYGGAEGSMLLTHICFYRESP